MQLKILWHTSPLTDGRTDKSEVWNSYLDYKCSIFIYYMSSLMYLLISALNLLTDIWANQLKNLTKPLHSIKEGQASALKRRGNLNTMVGKVWNSIKFWDVVWERCSLLCQQINGTRNPSRDFKAHPLNQSYTSSAISKRSRIHIKRPFKIGI